MTDEERVWLKALYDRRGDLDGMASKVEQLWARRGLIDAIANLDAGDDADEAEIARLVLAGLDSDAMSDAQVQDIIDALPEAVKQALREGVG